MMIEKIVVTGAAGFVGSHLCEALLAAGHQVMGIDNFDDFYDPQVKRHNVARCLGHPAFKLIEADIRDVARMRECLRGGDVVMHLAARAGVRPSIENPLLYQDVNVTGTAVLLEAARQAQVRRFIFTSSSSVYGNNPKVPFSETDNVDHPISPYAATKKAGELLAHTYHHLFGMDVACLRLFTVYGPRQRPDLAIHKFARLIEAGRPIPMFGDGSMERDYTFVDDIVAGFVAAMRQTNGYKIYNLGNSSPVSLAGLIAALESALGRRALIDPQPEQPGDVRRTYADIERAGKELGWSPRLSLAQGLERFVAWLRRDEQGLGGGPCV